MKYKVGDKVRVRQNLVKGRCYFMSDMSVWNNCVPEMIKLGGEVVTIEGVTGDILNQYTIRELRGFRWTDEMFEDLHIGNVDIEDLL